MAITQKDQEILQQISKLSREAKNMAKGYEDKLPEEVKVVLEEMDLFYNKIQDNYQQEENDDNETLIVSVGADFLPKMICITTHDAATTLLKQEANQKTTLNFTPQNMEDKKTYLAIAYEDIDPWKNKNTAREKMPFLFTKQDVIKIKIISKSEKKVELQTKLISAINLWARNATDGIYLYFGYIYNCLINGVIGDLSQIEEADVDSIADAGIKAINFMYAESLKPITNSAGDLIKKGVALCGWVSAAAKGSPLGFIVACAFDIVIGKWCDDTYEAPIKKIIKDEQGSKLDILMKAFKKTFFEQFIKQQEVTKKINDIRDEYTEDVPKINDINDFLKLQLLFETAAIEVLNNQKNPFGFTKSEVLKAALKNTRSFALMDAFAEYIEWRNLLGCVEAAFNKIGISPRRATIYEASANMELMKANLPVGSFQEADNLKSLILRRRFFANLADRNHFTDKKKLESLLFSSLSTVEGHILSDDLSKFINAPDKEDQLWLVVKEISLDCDKGDVEAESYNYADWRVRKLWWGMGKKGGKPLGDGTLNL